jgi:hypothetical protein
MALNWSAVLEEKGDSWSIPAGQVSAMDALMVAAQSALAATKGEGRGPVAGRNASHFVLEFASQTPLNYRRAVCVANCKQMA